VCAHKMSHLNSPSFIDKFIHYSSWVINLLLDVLVCSITVYFYKLFFILTCPTGLSKYGTTRKNIQRYYEPKHLIRNYVIDKSHLTVFLLSRCVSLNFLTHSSSSSVSCCAKEICTLPIFSVSKQGKHNNC